MAIANILSVILREVRRRTRVVGAFPDGNSALMLVAARLRHIAGTKWGTRRYLNMNLLKKWKLKRRLPLKPNGHRAQKCERFLTLPYRFLAQGLWRKKAP
jgi:hypothetical protein